MVASPTCSYHDVMEFPLVRDKVVLQFCHDNGDFSVLVGQVLVDIAPIGTLDHGSDCVQEFDNNLTQCECGHMSKVSTQVTPKVSLVKVSPLPKLLPNLLTLLDLVATSRLRRGCNLLVKPPHSMGAGVAGPAQAQLSC